MRLDHVSYAVSHNELVDTVQRLGQQVADLDRDAPERKEQLVQRLLCMEGHVDSSRLRSGFLAKAEFPKLQRAAGVLMSA